MNTTVLIVDDETVTRHMLKMLLELSGFVIDEARDGVEALEKVKQHIPDAMILDVMMPRLDGITTCRQLRDDPDTADLFILMLSGGDDHTRGLEAGANIYMEKPMNADSLIQTLKSLSKQDH